LSKSELCIKSLGQTGYRIHYDKTTIYIDPYLSNSVQEKEDINMSRLIPIPISPTEITDADYVLITHEHRDHCDEDTLRPISLASPQSIFIATPPVSEKLSSWGIADSRIIIAKKKTIRLNDAISVDIVPSAHPEVISCEGGGWKEIGFIINIDGKKIYHAGDTSLTHEVLEYLKKEKKIEIGIIPVNEHNFMKAEMGITGNMTIREAFYLAEFLEVDYLIPSHWDMFQMNEVFFEEIMLVYHKVNYDFEIISPSYERDVVL
jgi:L-ascorbate 6-phosphate lactonase